MDRTDNPQGAAQRIHFLDVARALFMLLGIPFHAARVYTGAPWLIGSPQHSAVLEFLPPVLNAFRMPGFFLIAGFFAAFLLEKRKAGDWLRARAIRLGLPLLTGMALIVPVQNAILRHAPREDIHLPTNMEGVMLAHLWFLPVLLMLCAALAGAWKVVVRLPWPDLPIWALGLAVGLWMVGLRGVVSAFHLNLMPMGGLIDAHAVLVNAPYFLLGVATRRNPAIFARLTRLDRGTLVIGLLAFIIYYKTWEPADRIQLVALLFAGAFAALCSIQAILTLLARSFNRPLKLVDRLVDASFSIYLFHHPIIIALALLLLSVQLPPAFEWMLICIVTLAASYLMHCALKRSQFLLLLFNGVIPKASRGLLTKPSALPPS